MLRFLSQAIAAGTRYFISSRVQLLLVLAMLVPGLTALFNWAYSNTVAQHPLTPALATGFVFVGGALSDPPAYSAVNSRLFQEPENLDINWEVIRNEVVREFVMCIHATFTYGFGLFIAYMYSLGINPFQPSLLLWSAVTLMVLTAVFPAIFLMGTWFVITSVRPERLETVSKVIGQVRQLIFATLANFLIYGLVGPNT